MKPRLLPLSVVLEDLFKKKQSVFSDIYFLYRLHESWKQLAGESIAKTASPAKFKNHELILNMPDSTHVQEMHFAKEFLKKKINKQFPEKNVQKITLSVKKNSNIFKV